MNKDSSKKGTLLFRTIINFLMGVVMVGVLLFAPAGTFRFWNAWLFLALLFVPMLIIGIYLWIKQPDLLAKRLSSKEKESEQKQVILMSAVVFVAGFVVAAVDFRFGWSQLPIWLVVVASVLLVISYGLYAEVMRENAYLSRTVEVQENQKVIDTGLYGIVRHPMYSATILLYLSIPLVLGSIYSFLLFLMFPFVIAKRISNEETVLEKGLDGYTSYKQRVKYKIIPFIW